MRTAFLALLMLAAGPADARDTLGQYGRWGAFRDGAHCYAIAQPQDRRADASAAFSSSARQGVRVQFHARLSRPADPARPATVRIGSRTFPLVVSGREARLADARADLRLVRAVRRGASMALSATDARGRRFTDRYALPGAASAIDAAMVGCLGR